MTVMSWFSYQFLEEKRRGRELTLINSYHTLIIKNKIMGVDKKSICYCFSIVNHYELHFIMKI